MIIKLNSINEFKRQIYNKKVQFRQLNKMTEKDIEPPLQPNMFKQTSDQSKGSSKNIQTIHRPNGAIYKGQTKDGLPHGRGVMTYKNGERYEGEFFEGNKNGKGKYYYIKGELYIGDWKNNVKDGYGQYFYQNGTRYTGEFQNNMKHGNGRLDQEDGTYYEGLFYMNNKDKYGIYFDALSQKKFMHVYENGKLTSQRQIMDQPQPKDQTPMNSTEKKIMQVFGQMQNDSVKDIVSQAVIVGFRQHESGLKGNNFNSEFHQSLLSLRNSIKNFQYNTIEVESGQKKKLIAQNYFEKNLIETKINQWTIKQVCDWLSQIGFGDCIEDFKENNIEGDSLLFLSNEDLKDLGITALGDRRILQREIEFLKLIFKSQCLGDTISKLRNKKLTFDVIEKIQQSQLKQENKERLERDREQKSSSKSTPEKQKDGESSSSQSSSDSEKQKQKQQRQKEYRRQKKRRQCQQSRPQQNMQTKIQKYMAKKGIKLNFLIPKEQIQIIEPIGKGGYGQVYLGKWLGQQVAVKKYIKKKGFRNKHVGHFIEEVQVINKLLHPSIVLYMGMCIDDNQYNMVTEFLSGGSLFDYLHKKNGKLSEEQVLEIMMDMALGMSYLHGKNVLHCDLKSSNVLIDQNWNVKLCDFGLSRINTREHKKKRQNIRVGTPHWMAPQILKGQKYECYSDVYSFGILVWQMITGKIPYKDLSTAQIVGLVGNNPNHHISIPKYGNEHVLKIFLICTEREPLKRPTFKFIVSELETALSKLNVKGKEQK